MEYEPKKMKIYVVFSNSFWSWRNINHNEIFHYLATNYSAALLNIVGPPISSIYVSEFMHGSFRFKSLLTWELFGILEAAGRMLQLLVPNQYSCF